MLTLDLAQILWRKQKLKTFTYDITILWAHVARCPDQAQHNARNPVRAG